MEDDLLDGLDALLRGEGNLVVLTADVCNHLINKQTNKQTSLTNNIRGHDLLLYSHTLPWYEPLVQEPQRSTASCQRGCEKVCYEIASGIQQIKWI